MTISDILLDTHLIVWRSPPVVKTKKTRSAVVINFHVAAHLDGCSKVHSRKDVVFCIFNAKTQFLGVHPQVTAAAATTATAAEEFSHHHQPPPHHAQGYHIPFGLPPHSDYIGGG